MNGDSFTQLAQLLKEQSGLVITPDKRYLVEARLSSIMRKYELSDLDRLAAVARLPASGALVDEVVDAMTTNETSFFRDRSPFESLRNTIIPALVANRGSRRALRFWCAACSTGQEPYSLAMLLRDQFGHLSDWRMEIVASDLSLSALERARDGVFSQFEVQRGLPAQLLVRHFDQVEQTWRIKPELRSMIVFRQLNLLSDIASLGQFDIILCRNVLIYFDLPTKASVLERMTRMLAPDGAIILGGAESVFNICDCLQEVAGARGVYSPAAVAAKSIATVPMRTAF